MDRARRHRPMGHPADPRIAPRIAPPWHRDPTLLFVALPALALVALRLWGG